MHYVGNWPTEVEIQAAASWLGVNIHTLIIAGLNSCKNRQLSKQAVYLKNCNSDQF